MATSIGKLTVTPRDLGSAQEILQAREEKATQGIQKAEWDTGLLMGQEGLGEAWHRATQAPWWDRESALLKVVEMAGAEPAAVLKAAWKEKQAVATAFASFGALCRMLSGAQNRDQDRNLGPVAQNVQLSTRYGMEQHVAIVEKAIAAAGDGIAAKFPLKQLGLIKANLKEQIDALEKKGANAITPLLGASEVDTLPKAASALARLLGSPALENSLIGAADRSGDSARYTKLLGAFAMLIDQASSAPDYATTGAGWHHPNTRIGYRQRRQSPEVLYVAEKRINESLDKGRDLAQAVGASKAPLEALEQALVSRFLGEIGKSEADVVGWKPSSDGIVQALSHELLLPLRALNETTQFMEAKHKGQKAAFETSVTNVTQAVVEGRYRDWRYSHPLSEKQLAVLKPAQREQWKADNVSAQDIGSHGGGLKTREEDGLDLFWLTKIGGPSHGFDYGGHCLLPLLSNARTKAIVVEDERWPDHPAGRAYLRLLSTPDGKPILYLEPTQRDFGHREKYPSGAVTDDFAVLLLRHAMKKAALLGLPLSVDAGLAKLAKEIGAKGQYEDQPVYVLAASAGVLEASDTLTNKHDWVQSFVEEVRPTPRFLIAAGEK